MTILLAAKPLISDPTMIFFVVLLIILFAPIIMSKLRIPHIIGMVLAGVLVGPFGLNILARGSPRLWRPYLLCSACHDVCNGEACPRL